MVQTRVDIVSRDTSGPAFTSANQNLTRLGSTVAQVAGRFTAAAGALGVFAAAASIRQIANLNDELAKISRNTGFAVETLAGLEFTAKQTGTSLQTVSEASVRLSRVILEAKGGTERYSVLIRALGLDLDKLKQSTPEEQFFAFTKAINENVAAQDRGAVLAALLGKRFAELGTFVNLSRKELSDYIAEGQRLNPVTQEAAEQAELFNDSLDRIGRSIKARFLPGINDMISSLADLAESFATTVQAGTGVVATVDQLASKKARIQEIREELQHIQGLRGSVGFLAPNQVATDLLEEELQNLLVDVERLEAQARDAGDAINGIIAPRVKPPVPGAFNSILRETQDLADAATEAAKGLAKQEAEARRLARAVEKLEGEVDPFVRRQQQLAELDTFKQAGLSAFAYQQRIEEINEEYNRSIGLITDIGDETKKLENVFKQTWDTNEQIAIGAIRRIQGALSDGIFNLFSGQGNFGSNLVDTFGRVASDVVSQKILQSVLPSGGGSSNALSLASLGVSGANLLRTGFGLTPSIGAGIQSIGNFVGSSAIASFGAGFAGPTAASTAAGLSSGVFGPGGLGFLSGGAQAAIAKGAEFGAAASLGAQAASFAGPALVVAAVDFGLKQLFGDKKLGGTAGDVLSFIPIVGTLINGLFGRGPLKFRNQTLQGTVGAGGLESLAQIDTFRAKGGLFRKDKVDNIIIDAQTGELLNQFGDFQEGGISSKLQPVVEQRTKEALQLGKLLTESFDAIQESVFDSAKTLGLGTAAFNNFSESINIVSEKGEALTQEQISGEILRISDAMVSTLVPSIEAFRLSNETNSEALSRAVGEFNALQNTLEVIGTETGHAKRLLRDLTLDQRNSIIDLAGGVETLNAQTANLFNQLGESRQLEILETRLSAALAEVNINFIPTMGQFIQVMTSGKLSLENFLLGFDLLPLISQFNELRVAVDRTRLLGTIDAENAAAQQALQRLSNSIAEERNRLTVQYNDDLKRQNDSIQRITRSIAELESLARSLESTSDQINPLSGGGARAQIRGAIAAASQGVLPAADTLSAALSALSGEGTEGFRSRQDFIRARAESDRLITELLGLARGALTRERGTLTTEQKELVNLQETFNAEIKILEDTLTDARLQTDLLRGIDSGIDSVETALTRLASLLAVGTNTLPTVALPGSSSSRGSGAGALIGPSQISDQAILQFLATNPNPQQLASAVRRVGGASAGVTSQRITRLLGGTEEDRLRFFALNPDIATFHEGGRSKREGFAIIKRDEVVSTQEQQTVMQHTFSKLLSKMDELLQTMQKDTISNNRASDVLEEWNRIGLPATAT